jgi:hypothetical protein
VSPDTQFPATGAGWAEFLVRAKESGLGWSAPGRAGPGGELVVEAAEAAGLRASEAKVRGFHRIGP